MATFFEAQKVALKRMKKMKDIAEQLGYTAVAENILGCMESMVRKKLVILVAGEVKRGKSSLLNAFLGETEEVCPVNQDVCTNTVTILQYGEEERFDVHIADPEAENGIRIETVARKNLSEYASENGNPSNYKNVVQIMAYLPNPLLKEGVVFIDTPGVGSLNPAHAEITHSFLPEADVLLFVTDSQTPMSATELDFLKRGYDKCSSVIFPLTKKDLNADYQAIADGNREKVSEALGIPENQIKIVPVSSMSKIKYLQDTTKERYYRNSNFAELERTVWTTVAGRQAEVRILPFLVGAETEFRKIADTLLAQLNAAKDEAYAADLQNKLNEYEAQLASLKEDGAEWKRNIAMFFSTKQVEIGAEEASIKNKAMGIINAQKTALNTKICEGEVMNMVYAEVNEVLISGLNNLFDSFEVELSQQLLSLYEKMNLDVSFTKGVTRGTLNVPDVFEVDIPKKKFLEKMKNQGREMGGNRYAWSSVGSTAGALIGGVIGGIIGGPVGAVAGAIGGSGMGATVAGGIVTVGNIPKLLSKDCYTSADVAIVVNALQAYVNDTYSKMTSDFTVKMQTLKIEIPNTFSKLLDNRIREIQKNKNDIIELLKTDKAGREDLCKELENKIKAVCTQISEAGALGEKIAKLSFSPETVVEESNSAKETNEDTEAPATYGFI